MRNMRISVILVVLNVLLAMIYVEHTNKPIVLFCFTSH